MKAIEEKTAFESTVDAGTRVLAVLCGALAATHVFSDSLQQSGLLVPAAVVTGCMMGAAPWWDEIKEGTQNFMKGLFSKENLR